MALKISVVIPSYNRESLIEPTLDSVRLQTCPAAEVLVIDDCSTDRTVQVIKAYADKFPDFPLRCIVQDRNQGVSAARNRGIHEARSEWIAFLDSDDLWKPEHLSGLQKAQAASNAEVIFSRVQGFSDEDPTAAQKTWTSRFANTDEVLKEMIQACHILPSAAMVSKSILIEYGSFDETPAIQHAEDWDLWLRLIEMGIKFQLHDEFTCLYRQHANSACSNKTRLYRAVLYCLKKHPDFPLASTAQWHKAIYYYQCKLARALYESGQDRSGSEFRKAWASPASRPTSLAAFVLCTSSAAVPPLDSITRRFLKKYF